MERRRLILLMVCILLAHGCTALQGKSGRKTDDRQSSSTRNKGKDKEKSERKSDGESASEDPISDDEAYEEEWSFVGKQGRAGQPREKDPSPWFQKYLMSDKARSIEHNLGID
jgi:hypothetical protein